MALCRTVRITAVPDQRPWSLVLDPLFPPRDRDHNPAGTRASSESPTHHSRAAASVWESTPLRHVDIGRQSPRSPASGDWTLAGRRAVWRLMSVPMRTYGPTHQPCCFLASRRNHTLAEGLTPCIQN